MRTVWKYRIPLEDTFECELPFGAQILTVAAQGDEPYFWAAVQPGERKAPVSFALVGTGSPIPTAGVYVGTFQLHGGALVYHLFRMPKPWGDKIVTDCY